MLAMPSVGKDTEAAGQRTQNTTDQNTRVGTKHGDRKQSCSTNTERRDLYQGGGINLVKEKPSLLIPNQAEETEGAAVIKLSQLQNHG